MASNIRRAPSRHTSKPSKGSPIDADQLAKDIGKKLTIGGAATGKQTVKEEGKNPESSKMASMRSINAASQALSVVVQSGWKGSSSDSSKVTLNTVNASANEAAKHLSTLRRMCPGDLDVERAAASVLGKLMALEMSELASASLREMHPRLCQLLDVTSSTTPPTHLLSIPRSSEPPTNPILLNLLSTYLLYAIILASRPECASPKSIDELAATLNLPTTQSLLHWLPIFSSLPTKQLDSMLTRAYTCLTKLCSSSASSSTASSRPKATTASGPTPESLFVLRMYALQCLARTSPGVIEANTFWDQATRFAAVFAKSIPSTGGSEERASSLILDAYSELARLTGERPDKEIFLAVDDTGRSFMAFCDYWASFAKKTGDISVLQRINSLMQQLSSNSSLSSSLKPSSESSESKSSESVPGGTGKQTERQRIVLEGTKLCNLLIQLSVLMENGVLVKEAAIGIAEADGDLRSLIRTCTQLLHTSTNLSLHLHQKSPTIEKRSREEEEVERICGKVDRTIEKVRRMVIKAVELHATSSAPATLSDKVDDALRDFLSALVSRLEFCLSKHILDAPATNDLLTRSLDTLFVLSRTRLNTNDPKTFITAFEHLAQASTIITLVPIDRFPPFPAENAVDIPNYTRCVSGAFYNLAGTLYQASRYGNAVPFLIESCALGQKALDLPRILQDPQNESREKEWRLIEEQLFRRWELLAVCYSKNGDRKNAYNAFKHAVITFPFSSSGLQEKCDTLAPDALFGASCSAAVKQLVTLVDRVSYIGACDLLLPPEEVSLRLIPSEPLSRGVELDPSVVGVLLERQLDSLESSRSKDGVRAVLVRMLREALDVYNTKADDGLVLMPIRRARIVVRCMEFVYHDPGDDLILAWGFKSLEEMSEHVEALGAMETFGQDASLVYFIPQYRVAANLWIALHAHRRADPEQNNIMTQRSEEACRLVKELLARRSETTPKATKKVAISKVVKISGSPKVARIVSPKATRSTRQRVPAAPKKAVPMRKTKAPVDPITPKSATRRALQPVTFNKVRTPPRRSVDATILPKSPLVFDDFDRLLSVLQLTARILGFLSLILAKAHLLDMTRRLSQRHLGSTSDGYVIASLDLAHEYVTLGKLKRAATIFNQALEIVRSDQASQDVAVRFLLRFAESLAIFEDIPKSSSVYLEALELSSQLSLEQKGMSTQQRIHARAKVLEISATAAHVFALLQSAKGDISASLEGSLQSLRLWNRAAETLTRLRPTSSGGSSESDPFEMMALKDALPGDGKLVPIQNISKSAVTVVDRRPPMDGLEWRISEGLLSTMFSLVQAYYLRGSAREAEYFAKQAADLAEQLNAPASVGRALARHGEIQLHMGQLEKAQLNLTNAANLLCDMPGIDVADIRRLKAECNTQMADSEDISQTFDETVAMLEELDSAFQQFDNIAFGPRRSVGASPGRLDVLAPELLASILSQQLWFLRDEIGDVFNAILEKFMSLSHSSHIKAEENALMAKLTLHSVYGRFRADMFLSSLTESTIAIPMGMQCKEVVHPTLPSVDIVDALGNAEKLLWSHLNMTAATGNVIKVREAAISLVLIGAFRTSLGDRRQDVPSIMASLLDASAALTLRRDMLDAIDHKFPLHSVDDIQWRLISEDGTVLPNSSTALKKVRMSSLSDSEDDDGNDSATSSDDFVGKYWTSIRAKYRAQVLTPCALSPSETTGLPNNWTVINISVTPDKSTLVCSRREGGIDQIEPLMFCIPLKGRREHGSGDEDEEYLTFEGAIQELQDIVHCSDECTKSAINIKSNDEVARSNWWRERSQLDVRMRELLENIEYCWLGAFKAILSPRPVISQDAISELRGQFEKVFHRSLHVKEKPSRKPTAHKKTASQALTYAPTQFKLDDAIVKIFSTLSAKCRDEELEDLIYFVLDLYQFHGVPVAIAEVDIDQVVVDIRVVLEEFSAKTIRQNKNSKSSQPTDEHLFLVLDKNVQALPWESLPILRGRSVSRIPGVQFLHDRLDFARRKREAAGQGHDTKDGAVVDPRKGYYILNPSGDLGRTEERFRDWSNSMKKAGWNGTVGESISEQQFVNALKSQDLVVYFGHGGGEQYVRSHRIRSLPTCAATMLWGCSSGALRDMGDFDRTGTPYNYMLAGCPTLVANLWDVTDKDIDKFSQSVFDKLSLNGKNVKQWAEKPSENSTSLVTAVAQSRDSCKLKYLTGAAPVVYGIPFYL